MGSSISSTVLSACLSVLAVLPAAAAQAGSPAGPVPVERLEARRSALMERMGVGVAVIRSARARSLEVDHPQDSDYRENNDFFYLTGLEAPGAALVLVARRGAPDSAILYLPEREETSERWTGGGLGPGAEAVRRTGIPNVRPATKAEGEIDRRRPRNFGPEIARLRQVKDADELRRLRRAVTITGEALAEAMRQARPGMREYELEAVIESGFRRRGAERVGFPSIVGSGLNGTVLHYDENRREMQPGELVVMDVGAEFGYYTADLTRTIPISGKFDDRQRRLYELVLGAQQAAIDSVRPGTDLLTLDRVAREYLRRHSDQLCGDSGCDRYFVHGLSHWLGMNVHDVGAYNRRLEAGMVLTVEPGIYLPAESVGIRIEDDVLVTDRGAEVLSSGVARTVEEVERAMAGR